MKVRKLLSPIVASLAVSFFASAAQQDFYPLKNNAIGNASCLTLASDGASLLFSACSDVSSQQWKLEKFEAYYYIRNKSSEKCLRTLGNGTTVNLGTCSGDGYTSMRLWDIKEGRAGVITLRNKYNNDLGKKQTLNATSAANIGMSTASNVEQMQWHYAGEIPAPVRAITGTKKVLLMATHFNGVTPNDPEPIRKAVLGGRDSDASLHNYMKQASHGKLNLTGTFLRNVNIGDRPATCSSSNILSSARAAALKLGVNPADYDYLFVDISRTSACSFEGLAAMPGNWIISNNVGHKVWMWSHEFGHNLGFQHSATLKNCPVKGGIVQLNSACTQGGGGDATDTMGGGGSKLYPANYQHYTTWLNDTEMPVITKAGIYNLYPLFSENMIVPVSRSDGRRGYRIKRNDGSVLVLEYRQPKGTFEKWDSNDQFVNGVTVRVMHYSGSSVKSVLIDTTPETSSNKDAPLLSGKAIYDELSGKYIRVIKIDTWGALIQIEDR